jgi:hypothetical protein
MRHIYYEVIDNITDWITGMNHHHLSLDEFAVWVRASAKVEEMMYVGIISILIAISAWCVFDLIKEYQMDLDKA